MNADMIAAWAVETDSMRSIRGVVVAMTMQA